jgi:hypothetical protein
LYRAVKIRFMIGLGIEDAGLIMRPLARSHSLRDRPGHRESDFVASDRCPCSHHYAWSLLDEDLTISAKELNQFLFDDLGKPMQYFLEHNRNFQSEYG